MRFLKSVLFFSLVLTGTGTGQVVHRLTADRFTHYRIDDWISYAPALVITSIEIDENYTYFGTVEGGILRYDLYEESWEYPYTVSSGLRSNFIIGIVYNPDEGFLYAQTPEGIDVFKPAEKFWRPSTRRSLPPGREAGITAQPNSGTSNNFRFPPFSRPGNSAIPDLFTDYNMTFLPDGTILDFQNREFKITDRIVDSWQRIWMGSDGLGPLQGDLFHLRLVKSSQSLPHISPRDIHLTDSEMWIAGLRNDGKIGGITRWDRRRDRWDYFESPYISGLYQDDVLAIAGMENLFFFATLQGLSVFDAAREKWRTFSTAHGLEGNTVLDVIADENYAYVGTEFGFNWIDLRSFKVYELQDTELDNVPVNQLAFGSDKIWAATRNGLYSVQPDSEMIQFYPSRAAISDYNLTAVEVSGDEIWMASRRGIVCWDRGRDTWSSYADLNLGAQIRDIAMTKNSVWFATDKGLLKYARKGDFWRLFTTRDGLISNDIYHLDPEGNRLWISSDRGITSFRWRRKGRID